MYRLLGLLCLVILAGAGCASSDKELISLKQERLEFEKDREKRITDSEIFDRKIKCQDMVDRFKKRYNNVTGGMYNGLTNSCDIEYRDGRTKEYSDMQYMSDN